MTCRIRKATGDERYYAPLDRRDVTMLRAVVISCYTPFSKSPLSVVWLDTASKYNPQSYYCWIAWRCSSTSGQP